MDTLSKIKTDFQLVDDNLGLAINELNAYNSYINKELALNVIRGLALWYENNPPTEDYTLKLNILTTAVQGDAYLIRLVNVFAANNKLFTLVTLGS